MGILSFLGSALKPITGLIDDLHTSDDERLAAKAVLRRLENEISIEMLGLERKIIEGQTSIIVAEAQSQSWLTCNWRPGTMVAFVGIVVHAYVTGTTPPPELMLTINIGLGGYIGGRTIEKGLGAVAKIMRTKEEV